MEKHLKELVKIILENLFFPHQLWSHKHKRENNLDQMWKRNILYLPGFHTNLLRSWFFFFNVVKEQVDILAWWLLNLLTSSWPSWVSHHKLMLCSFILLEPEELYFKL